MPYIIEGDNYTNLEEVARLNQLLLNREKVSVYTMIVKKSSQNFAGVRYKL